MFPDNYICNQKHPYWIVEVTYHEKIGSSVTRVLKTNWFIIHTDDVLSMEFTFNKFKPNPKDYDAAFFEKVKNLIPCVDKDQEFTYVLHKPDFIGKTEKIFKIKKKD